MDTPIWASIYEQTYTFAIYEFAYRGAHIVAFIYYRTYRCQYIGNSRWDFFTQVRAYMCYHIWTSIYEHTYMCPPIRTHIYGRPYMDVHIWLPIYVPEISIYHHFFFIFFFSIWWFIYDSAQRPYTAAYEHMHATEYL